MSAELIYRSYRLRLLKYEGVNKKKCSGVEIGMGVVTVLERM